MKFPKLFDKCPLCGCKERVIESVADELKKEGKVRKDISFSTAPPIPLALVDPGKTVISATTLMIMRDLCAKCGFEYTVRVYRQEMPWPPPPLQQALGQQILSKIGEMGIPFQQGS